MKIEIEADSYTLWQKTKELIEFAYENKKSEVSHHIIQKLESINERCE